MIARGRDLCDHAGAMNMQAGAAPDTFVGRVLAEKYRVVSLLGEGGMGAVYLGEQSLGTAIRKVAIKTLHAHLSHDPQIRARFEREVGTVAGLEHPNTIQVYDYGATPEGLLYIVMEYVQGKSLADILEREGAMPLARTLHIMNQVCGSLEEAHRAGIVHRDLKPDNIVLCEKAGQKDWVEVLDFGIAKRSTENDPNEAKLTQQGMVLGTPPYMSPEQFTGQPIGPQSDIYSLAVMTYEMLTGRMPYTANTAWEWASQHMSAQPFPFEGVPSGAGLPQGVRTAILRGLEKNPQSRYASVMDFYETLKQGGSAAAGAPPPPPPAARAHTEVAAAVPMQGQYGAVPTPAPMPAYGGNPGAYGPGGSVNQVGSPMGGATGFGPSPQGAGGQGGYGQGQAGYGQQPVGAGMQGGPMMTPNYNAHPPKKGNTGLILGLVGGALLLFGAGGAGLYFVLGSKDDAPVTAVISPVPTPTTSVAATATTPEPVDTGLPSLSSVSVPAAGGKIGGPKATGGTAAAGGSIIKPNPPGTPPTTATVAPAVVIKPPSAAIDPAIVNICNLAKAAAAAGNDNAPLLARKCKMGGGGNLL
jgi:eukaryotic-like serine/threonine-protein kinase